MDPVSNGCTCINFDGAYQYLDLETGKTTEIELIHPAPDSVQICGNTEGKLVGFEYINTIQNTSNEPAVDVFYMAPGKGKVSISAWAGHVRAHSKLYGLDGCKLVNGRLLLPLMGADGENYVGLVDENGQQLMGPLKTERFISFASDSDCIVVQEDGVSVVYDVQGNELFRATDYGIKYISAYENGVAEAGEKIILDPDGKMLITNFFIDTHQMPMLPLSGN